MVSRFTEPTKRLSNAQRHIVPNFDYNIIIKLIFVCLLFDTKFH